MRRPLGGVRHRALRSARCGVIVQLAKKGASVLIKRIQMKNFLFRSFHNQFLFIFLMQFILIRLALSGIIIIRKSKKVKVKEGQKQIVRAGKTQKIM